MADQRAQWDEAGTGANHPSLPDIVNRLALVSHNNDGTHKKLDIGSGDANGDMYYRAAGVLARLAKGTADQKLFTNAGATAPEWANGFQIGALTRDLSAASGSVPYTGVGFKPSVIIFFGLVGGDDYSISQGLDNITNAVCTAYLASTTFGSNTYSIILSLDTGTNFQTARASSFDSDGFTLNWTKAGTPTGSGSVYYLALR